MAYHIKGSDWLHAPRATVEKKYRKLASTSRYAVEKKKKLEIMSIIILLRKKELTYSVLKTKTLRSPGQPQRACLHSVSFTMIKLHPLI